MFPPPICPKRPSSIWSCASPFYLEIAHNAMAANSSGNIVVHQIGNPTCSDVTCYLLPYPYVSTHYVHYRFTAASRWKPLSPPSRQSSCHICFCFIQPIEQQQQCREPLDCWESLSPRSNTAQGTPSHTAHGMAFTFFDVCAARKEETSTQLLLLRTQKP